jgi:hypothetical protein
VAGHTAARRAIRAVSPPGTLWSRLTRIGDSGWIEFCAWERRETFDRALERSADDPVARPWFELAEPGYTISLGDARSRPQPPPREGELELAWWRNEAGAGSDQAAAQGWELRAEVGSSVWTDSGWIERDPMLLVITAAGAADAGEDGSSKGEPLRERVRIAHAVDPAEEAA